eukprot:1195088-Prorocentrum_minimum.AAC.2
MRRPHKWSSTTARGLTHPSREARTALVTAIPEILQSQRSEQCFGHRSTCFTPKCVGHKEATFECRVHDMQWRGDTLPGASPDHQHIVGHRIESERHFTAHIGSSTG